MGVLLILFGAGCASTPLRLADAVGPAPQLPVTDGQLVVYTEIYDRGMPDWSAPEVREPYEVLDDRGVALQTVKSPDDEPPIVTLRAGDYIVRGRGLGKSSVEVPVRIVPGRTTEVHLDGTGYSSKLEASSAVYGPDGSRIGSRAVPSR